MYVKLKPKDKILSYDRLKFDIQFYKLQDQEIKK